MKQRIRKFTCIHCGKKGAFDPATVPSKRHLMEQVQVPPMDSLIAYLPICRYCGQENEVASSSRNDGVSMNSKRRRGNKLSAGRVVGSSGFWQPKTVEELAAEQGVKPVDDPNELRGDFWPPEESMDDFLAWLRKLRQERKGDG